MMRIDVAFGSEVGRYCQEESQSSEKTQWRLDAK